MSSSDMETEVEVRTARSSQSGSGANAADSVQRVGNAPPPANAARKRRSIVVGMQAATESIKGKQVIFYLDHLELSLVFS